MAQTKALLTTLKKLLKAHGHTYVDVAQALDLTEASVKRLFSEQSFSLERLDKVCQMLDMEISDLVQAMHEQAHQIKNLSYEQEQEITSDLTLLLVAVCVMNKWTLAEITSHFDISETEGIRKLARLDKLQIIDLLPGNRIKLRVAPNFEWLENGPIMSFFLQNIAREFFNSRFQADNETLFVLNGMLSPQSNAEYQRKIKRLARDFAELNNDDAALSISMRKGVTTVLAVRDWNYGLFKPLLRTAD
ncbi:MAG: helix-turn-helix transcriptional regulator [Gammaproteobacteria bacterium]|nr:helix-turn-helix transcriptional regulator [Gammaproteobacteria bacterium]